MIRFLVIFQIIFLPLFFSTSDFVPKNELAALVSSEEVCLTQVDSLRRSLLKFEEKNFKQLFCIFSNDFKHLINSTFDLFFPSSFILLTNLGLDFKSRSRIPPPSLNG